MATDQLDRVVRGGGRAGLVARGAMYCVAAFLAARVAAGASEHIDREGALEALARQRIGSVLIAVLALGFSGYAAWRLAKAIRGDDERSARGDAAGPFTRLADVARAAIYVSGVVTCVRLIAGGRDAVGNEPREKEWSARLMEQGWGRAVVFAAGLALVTWGVVAAFRAVRERFAEKLETRKMAAWERRLFPPIGTVGYTARGAVAAAMGVFIVRAAWRFDPREAEGIDGALQRLASQAWGTWLLVAVALGLLAFGVFSFVEARYRRVLDD